MEPTVGTVTSKDANHSLFLTTDQAKMNVANNLPPVPARQGDATQWQITWTDADEPDEVDTATSFRRAYDIALAPVHIENDEDWEFQSREAVWAAFHDPAVMSVVVATNADGRTILMARI